MTDFIRTETAYGRTETFVDIPAIATALANALGGKVANNDFGNRPTLAQITVGDLNITLRSGYGAKATKVEVHASSVKSFPHIYQTTAMRYPSISFSADRAVDKIAADIKRRVIEPSAPALASQEAAEAKRLAVASDLDAHIVALKKACPTLDLTKEDGGQVAKIWNRSPGGAYFSGRLHSDGSVTVEHCQSFKPDRSAQIISLIIGA